MSKTQNPYGLPQVTNRPNVKATKQFNLDSEKGKQIIKSETTKLLRNHKKTFEKLATM